MKTLVKENKSIYLFEDTTQVTMTDTNIEVGNPIEFIIGDCSNTDTTLYENITAPTDWSGHKYFYDGTDWTLNPDWVDPATIMEQNSI